MNMKKNKKNQILVAGTMAFDEIITKNANSGRVIGGAATYISYSASFFTNNIYVSSIIGNDFPLTFLDEMNSTIVEIVEYVKNHVHFKYDCYTWDSSQKIVKHDQNALCMQHQYLNIASRLVWQNNV